MTRAPTEMETRVAKAICREIAEDHLASGFAGPQDFQDGLDADWCEFLPTARTAIRAMRDPTPEMIGAEFVYKNCQMCGGASELYPRMIDAASPIETQAIEKD